LFSASLNKKLIDLELSKQLIAELSPETIAGLTPDKRRKYDMWLDGVSSKYYTPVTVERDRKFFLELGLDIARTHSQTLNAVLLSNRISPTKLKMTYPARLVEMGAILQKSK